MIYYVKPIGIVRSAVTQSRDMPLQGVPAVIEIYEEFLEGMSGMQDDTHINVIGWFDKADRAPLMVAPRKINPELEKRGVFSLRSPTRPNPLSLSATRLLKVEGRHLYVEALDLINESPIIDIKPYSAGWDVVFWARDAHSSLIVQHTKQAEALAEFVREAYNFHGEKCAAAAVAAKISYDATAELGVSTRDMCVQLPRQVDPHLADSLIGITRATLGNGRLVVCLDQHEVRLSSGNRSIGYRVFEKLPSDPNRVLDMTSEELFLKSA
jgi:tRNA-Thr(GGU) m(6)t(6)A37 methyltransferase TsaA